MQAMKSVREINQLAHTVQIMSKIIIMKIVFRNHLPIILRPRKSPAEPPMSEINADIGYVPCSS